MKVKVIGLKRFSGTIGEGRAAQQVDSGKVFCEVRLDDSRNSEKQLAKGYASEELRCPPEVIKRIEHVTLPFMADVETERVSNGRESKEVVVDIRPLDMVRPVDAPARPVPKAA